jgi:hypothetical protein
LAAAYGWAKDYIWYNVYFDEAWELLNTIRRRKNVEYATLTQIFHSSKPQDLIKMFTVEEQVSEELDEAGFESFKQVVSGSGHFIVK